MRVIPGVVAVAVARQPELAEVAEPPLARSQSQSLQSRPHDNGADALDTIVVLIKPVGNKAGNYSFFGLLVIGFFWVSGGCYGNEELFASAPPGIVLPCLLLVPFFYSLPLAMITTELTAMMPFDGGLVRSETQQTARGGRKRRRAAVR